jgi:hypothetical protein
MYTFSPAAGVQNIPQYNCIYLRSGLDPGYAALWPPAAFSALQSRDNAIFDMGTTVRLAGTRSRSEIIKEHNSRDDVILA